MKSTDSLFTPTEASAYLDQEHGIALSRDTLANLRCTGRGPTFQRDGRRIRYRRAWLDAYATTRLTVPMRSTKEPAAVALIGGAP